MKKNYLERLHLKNYRNFSDLSLSFNKDVILISGPNGSGKTNILESISLLAPGKGLRAAQFDDLCLNGDIFWKSNFHLDSKIGAADISFDYTKSSKGRVIKYNGSKSSASELLNLLNVVWLTPQMEGLFLAQPAARRKFFDRIVYNFDPTIASSLAKYDYYLRERMKALSPHTIEQFDTNWLLVLEEKIAIQGLYIAKARDNAILQLQEAIDKLDSHFPKAILSTSQSFEDDIKSYMQQLLQNRKKDGFSGRTNFGVHKVDFLVTHSGKGKLAKLCSTGEQKAMMISLTLAQVDSILRKVKSKPLLLLDEVFVHLDEERKGYLADYIMNSKIQTFITTTESKDFYPFAGLVQEISL